MWTRQEVYTCTGWLGCEDVGGARGGECGPGRRCIPVLGGWGVRMWVGPEVESGNQASAVCSFVQSCKTRKTIKT